MHFMPYEAISGVSMVRSSLQVDLVKDSELDDLLKRIRVSCGRP